MPGFAATRAIMAATRKILSTTHTILALTCFVTLVCIYEAKGGGLEEPQGGTPPIHEKNFNV